MGTIAKGSITINNVNDAYTVSLTPSSVVINVNNEGIPADLSEATTTLSISRGGNQISFYLDNITVTNCTIETPLIRPDRPLQSLTLFLNHIDSDKTNGNIEISFHTQDNFNSTAKFTYTTVREAGMLDWIEEWDNNKTRIDGESIITPKIFVGARIETEEVDGVETVSQDSLTGVYIGPVNNTLGVASTGIYGFQAGNEIFHINDEGGVIGGWQISENGLQTLNGKLQINANGTLQFLDPENNPYWQLASDGSGVLAHGNLTWNSDGNVAIEGSIKAESGSIGSWQIDGGLYTENVRITPTEIVYSYQIGSQTLLTEHYIQNNGGVRIGYEEDLDNPEQDIFYGIQVWKTHQQAGSPRLLFSAGIKNKIAFWSFNERAIYSSSEEIDFETGFANDGIVLSPTDGLHGRAWVLGINGSGKLANNNLSWSTSGTLDMSVSKLGYQTPANITSANCGSYINLNVQTWDGLLPVLAEGEHRQLTIVWQVDANEDRFKTIGRQNSSVEIKLVNDADVYSSIDIKWGFMMTIYGYGTGSKTVWSLPVASGLYYTNYVLA